MNRRRQQVLAEALLRSIGTARLVVVVSLLVAGLVILVRDGTLLARGAHPDAPQAPYQDLDLSDAPLVAVSQPRSATPTAAPETATAPAASGPPAADLQAATPLPDPRLPTWAVNKVETSLWSAPIDGTLFAKLPTGVAFRTLERQANRFRIFYSGDRTSHPPGEAWVDVADLIPAAWPRWVRLRGAGSIVANPYAGAPVISILRAGEYVEVIGDARGAWAHVFYLGDGRQGSSEGWLEAGPTVVIPGADVVSSFALTRDVLQTAGPSVLLKVPYRSQIDGSSFALANCGPTTAGMVLESFGFKISPPVLRREVLSLQPDENCDDCGVYIQNLAEVISRRGLKIAGLRDDDPNAFHHWTLADVKNEVLVGHPVVAQVFFRGLPGRETSPYWGDHFIVVTGLLGDKLVYNDPIDVEGPGYSRLIGASALERAMSNSDYPYAAFSVGR